MSQRHRPANDIEAPALIGHASGRIGPRSAPSEGNTGSPSADRCADVLISRPTAVDDVDELVVELARFCAELMFEMPFSGEPANDDS